MRIGTDSPSETTYIGRILSGWISVVCRRPRTVLALALAVCLVSVYASVTHLKYQTQRSDLISPDKECQRLWQQYVDEFGDDDDIVVVVKGQLPTDGPRMKAAIDAVAAEAAVDSRHFDHLFYQVDLRYLRSRALLYLPTEQVVRIAENLQSMSLLLEVGPLAWRNLSFLSLLNEARLRANGFVPGEPMPLKDERFFNQFCSVCRSAAAILDNPANYRNPWNRLVDQPADQQTLLDEPTYFFSGDGTLAFLLVRPVKDLGSFAGAAESVHAMRDIVADVQSNFTDVEIGLTGLPVLESDEMVAAERDARRASWLAIGGVTLLFFVVYRGICYPLLTVGTLLLGTSWAMGWTTLTVGHLNILSATFAVMLIGMGDYGVLWVMRYESERKRGQDVESALRQTAVCVGTGTLTAALTTAVAFYAAMLADFKAVAELGWIAGSGVLLCAFACFTVLPAVLKVFDRRKREAINQDYSSFIVHRSSFETWLPGLQKKSRWVLAGSLAMALALGVFATRVSYDHNLLNLQPRDLDSVKWEKTLIGHMAGASWHAVSYARNSEEALALKAHYARLPEVSRVVEVASLVPPDQDVKLEQLREIERRLSRLPNRGEKIGRETPEPAALRASVAEAMAALLPWAGRDGISLCNEVRASLEQLLTRLNDGGGGDVLRDFEERMAGDLLADLYRLRDVSSPERITLADIPAPLRERFIGRNGYWKLQAFAKDDLWNFEPLEHFVKQVRTVDSEATGKPFSTVEGLTAMKNEFLRAGLYAFVAIVVVLAVDFRNVRRTLTAVAPLLMGMTFALGIMGLFGVPLNPANMIALPLVLGVGVDNGVHIVHDFLSRKAEGQFQLSRAIGQGVLVKALTTMISFGTLMISTQPGLAGLGFCLTLGVASCMVSSLIFLPALMQRREAPALHIAFTEERLQRRAA